MAGATLKAGSTYRFKLTATKDGAVWDLTGATVTLLLRKPDATQETKSASLLVAASGTAYYDSLTTDLAAADRGRWWRAWRVVQGSIDVTGDEIDFVVAVSPHV
jgi:hypothetical protein